MKKYLLSIAMLALVSTPAHALTVTCTNCSNSLVQLLDRITSMEQLQNVIGQYHENIQQTAQQIRMVQQNIEQYQNMIQNTVQLPANLVNELKGNLTRLANLSSNLKTLRGDIAPADWARFQQRLQIVQMSWDNERAPMILTHHWAQGVKLDDALKTGEWQYDDDTIAAVLPIAYAQLAAEGKVPRPKLRLL